MMYVRSIAMESELPELVAWLTEDPVKDDDGAKALAVLAAKATRTAATFILRGDETGCREA